MAMKRVAAKVSDLSDPAVLKSIKKIVAANKKRYATSKRAAVAMLKREGILTAKGHVATKYR